MKGPSGSTDTFRSRVLGLSDQTELVQIHVALDTRGESAWGRIQGLGIWKRRLPGGNGPDSFPRAEHQPSSDFSCGLQHVKSLYSENETRFGRGIFPSSKNGCNQ